ncbi:hypothetical protein ACPOLB_23515 [Rubrivivax sp. RP6-9]|uniref:hypothetical protein n=1 Tax=Rubrivivax sp. RP6-9 TaxID=3415750 RepID=UPI003CC5371B
MKTLVGSGPFGDPSESERLALAIERLSDPHANHDDVAQGIDALGARRRPEDIDRLVHMSHDRATPDHVHQWIAEALLPSESELEHVEVMLERVDARTREALVDILSNVFPEWSNKVKPRGAA